MAPLVYCEPPKMSSARAPNKVGKGRMPLAKGIGKRVGKGRMAKGGCCASLIMSPFVLDRNVPLM